MLYHNKCGNILRAEIPQEAVKLLATFSVEGKFTAKINELSLWKTGLNKVSLIYFCTYCGKNIEEEDDILFVCGNCGKEHPISEIKIPVDSGGVFCENCSKRFEAEEKLYNFALKDIKI